MTISGNTANEIVILVQVEAQVEVQTEVQVEIQVEVQVEFQVIGQITLLVFHSCRYIKYNKSKA